MNKILIAAILALAGTAAGAQAPGTTAPPSPLPPETPEESATPPAAPPAGRLGIGIGVKSTLDLTPAVTLTDDERFARFDGNSDGSLGRDEVAANSELSIRFRALDKNGDGKLSKVEFAARNKDMSR